MKNFKYSPRPANMFNVILVVFENILMNLHFKVEAQWTPIHKLEAPAKAC